jgi:hypothetical protein
MLLFAFNSQGERLIYPKPKENNFIPTDLYSQIVKLIPIVSVEALIIIDYALLFLKRNNQPAK